MPLLKRLINETNPDIICLQETKVSDDLFPINQITELGYKYVIFSGEKSYNGVAIISKIPLENVNKYKFGGNSHTRHISATICGDIELHNFYIPAGGDEPDPLINPKFAHKLAYLDEITSWFTEYYNQSHKLILVGDLNIAPYEHDVWSHKQLLKIVSHTPIEVEKLSKLKETLDWCDVARHFTPLDQKLYSWWSYRSPDFEANDRGRRLDHIWITDNLKTKLLSCDIIKAARKWDRPSDHVPVVLEIEIQ